MPGQYSVQINKLLNDTVVVFSNLRIGQINRKASYILFSIGLVALAMILFVREGAQLRVKNASIENNSLLITQVESKRQRLEAAAVYEKILTEPLCTSTRTINIDGVAISAISYDDAGLKRILVVGPKGVIESIEADFRPNRLDLGQSDNGDVLVAFGNTRLGSKIDRGLTAEQPVQIFRNGSLEYASNQALDFGVASDASAFFVVESIGENETRLITRSFSSGAEFHYSLTGKLSSEAIEGNYSIMIGNTNKTVALVPAADSGLPAIFFGMHSESEIELKPPERLSMVSAMYASESDVVYSIGSGDGRTTMVRMRVDTSSEPFTMEQVWSREIPNIVLGGQTRLSPDGKWVLVNAEKIELLNADTGDSLFEWPMGKEDAEYLLRLTTVDTLATEKAHDPGLVFGAKFVGGHLVIDRRFGTRSVLDCQSGPTQPECVRKARESIVKVQDAFRLDTISMSSSPDFRIADDGSRGACVGRDAIHKLVIVDGDLATVVPNS